MDYSIKQFTNYFLPITILLIGIFNVTMYAAPSIPIMLLLDKTIIKWAVSFFILTLFFLSWRFFFDKMNNKNMMVVHIFLIWTFISIIRGLFEVESYWDWRGLISNVMGLLLVMVVYTATNKVAVQSLLAFYVKYALPLFLFLIFLISKTAYGFYLMPVSFLF